MTGSRFCCDRRAQSSSSTSRHGEDGDGKAVGKGRCARDRARPGRQEDGQRVSVDLGRLKVRSRRRRERDPVRRRPSGRSSRPLRPQLPRALYPNMSLTRSKRFRSSCSSRVARAARTSPWAAPWRAVRAGGAAPWSVSSASAPARSRTDRRARGRSTSGMPLPRSRSVVPVWVPSGTFTVSVPSSVGTRDFAAERQRREVDWNLAEQIDRRRAGRTRAPARARRRRGVRQGRRPLPASPSPCSRSC